MLRLEHRDSDKMLDRFGEQLNELKEGGTFDRVLVNDILHYLSSYGDRCHYPKETLIHERLRTRSPQAAAGSADLFAEHADLAKSLHAMAGLVDEAFLGSEQHRAELIAAGWDYAAALRRHIEREETRFFPAALEHLVEGDWEDIDFAVFDRPEPMFSAKTDLHFRNLRRSILEPPSDADGG